jgi:glycosyltransferase involved in cell wall biosynthesis
MGRYVRPILRGLAQRDDIRLTLLVREPRAAPAYRAIVGETVEVAPLSAARVGNAFDRVWYPWNGIRFRARAPALVTINDDFAFAYPARDFVARWREQAPIRRAVRRATHIVTISTWSRQSLCKRFRLHPNRVSVLPLGPDDYFSPGPATTPFGEPFVLIIGTGEARKNVAFLIDAFARAFPGGDVRLVIVGGCDAALAARLRKLRVPIAILTRVADEQLRRLYRTAAAVAVPSLAEGFGLVAAEAQACGAAVLAAAGSALPETVGDAALSLDPRDGSAWRDGLRELVCDPALNARYRALAVNRWAGFSADRTLQALLVALQGMVDDRM